MTPRPGQRGDGRNADVVAEQQGRRASTATATIQDDVIHTSIKGKLDIGFDMVGRHFHTDRNAARDLTHMVAKGSEVVATDEIGKCRW